MLPKTTIALVALCAACSADGKLKASASASAPATPARADASAAESSPAIEAGSDLALPGALSDAGPRPACTGMAAAAPTPCAAAGINLAPGFVPEYTCFDLGPVPGVPAQKYGGLLLEQDWCSDTLLIGGEANTERGKLYAIKVRRDAAGHVSGFEGTARVVVDAPFNDGGITYGPGGVLFFARWPSNELQQTRPGSSAADKVIPLMPFGFGFSSASLAFVPAGFPSAGALKMVSWPIGHWYTTVLAPDGDGLFNVKRLQTVDRTVPGGPEGFVYVAAGSPKFGKHGVLVSEWDAKRVSTYEIDDNAEPVVATRRDFVTGLNGAEGAYRDPATGDFFFSTFTYAAPDRVIVVRGFVPFTVE